jgi:hypothetical protein
MPAVVQRWDCSDALAKVAKFQKRFPDNALVDQRCPNQTSEQTLRGQPEEHRPHCDSHATSAIWSLPLAHIRRISVKTNTDWVVAKEQRTH